MHHSSQTNGGSERADSDSRCPNVSANDTCGTSSSSDASPDSKYDANPSSSHDALELQNKAGLDDPVEDNQSDDETDSQSGNRETESASDGENLATSMDYNTVDKGNKMVVSDSAIEKNTESHEDGDIDMDAVDAVDNVEETLSGNKLAESSVGESDEHNSWSNTTSKGVNHVDNVAVSDELEVRVSDKENTLAGSESVKKLAMLASLERALISGTRTKCDAIKMETKSTLDIRRDLSGYCEEHNVCDQVSDLQ